MRTILLVALAAVLAAAETPADDATRRRAEDALAAYAGGQQPAAPIDPALLAKVVDAEGLLAAGERRLAAGDPALAGDLWLKASTILRTLSKEERAALGARLKPAEDAALTLARRLVDGDALGEGPGAR